MLTDDGVQCWQQRHLKPVPSQPVPGFERRRRRKVDLRQQVLDLEDRLHDVVALLRQLELPTELQVRDIRDQIRSVIEGRCAA